MVRARVLVVEDDTTIGRGVEQALSTNGYDVEWVTSGQGALSAAAARSADLVVLDLGLPDIDGLEVCGHLRRTCPDLAIVVLTARADEIDIVGGLDAGADDYVTKPFGLSELLARIRVQLRRPGPPRDADAYRVGDVTVDVVAHRVLVGDRELAMRPKEFHLLTLLAENTGKVVPRDRIMREVWDAHWYGSTKTLDMHISSLRRRLWESDVVITTIPRVGYRLEPVATRTDP